MKRRAALATLAVCLALQGLAGSARAQLAASNLLIGESGNRLDTTPRDRIDLYDRLDLAWRGDGFAAGLRYEHDRSSDDSPAAGRLAAYDQLTQRWVEWEDAHARLRAGNFYTLLGRGLLHRSFELPGVVFDEAGSGTRYAAARDVDGVLAEGDLGPLAATAFSGRPNDATVSPASAALGADRYQGVLDGAQLESALGKGARAGVAWTRYDFGDAPTRQYGSGFASADLVRLAGSGSVSLPVYFEYAQGQGDFADWWKLRRGPETPHALYASAQLLWRAFSYSLEWKDYDQFRLGLNDPPSLVREQASALLNRETHLLDANGEAGFQMEGSAPLASFATLTANLSRSDAPPGVFWQHFEERYAEVRCAPRGREDWSATVFTDRGQDTFDFIADRHTAGISGQRKLGGGFALEGDLERQRATSAPFGSRGRRHEDRYVQLGASRAGWGSIALAATRTDDPVDLPSDTFGNPTRDHAWFVGVTATAEVSRMHTLSLFAGRRRAGRACTSGTCYDVPSFAGAELRWNTRL